VDTSSPLDSGLTESQRLSCLLHDSEGRILKMASCLSLSIGSRVMLIQNVDTKLGLVNGTTGTVVGFVFSRHQAHTLFWKNLMLSVLPYLNHNCLCFLLKSTKSFGTLQNTTSTFHRH
jgi:hypothetical protein